MLGTCVPAHSCTRWTRRRPADRQKSAGRSDRFREAPIENQRNCWVAATLAGLSVTSGSHMIIGNRDSQMFGLRYQSDVARFGHLQGAVSDMAYGNVLPGLGPLFWRPFLSVLDLLPGQCSPRRV